MSSDPVTHSKDLDARPPKPANRTITTISRSEVPVSSCSRTPAVSEYMKEVLVWEGSDSELCFEEVRVERHFCKLRERQDREKREIRTASLRVDSILGEGAFATVYRATDPVTSEKMILKVQKPANPWEFYINTCLDARLKPAHRHLFSSIHSAHLFRNGSVLLGELHNLGTLLNMVNIYRTLSERVVPQPLVLYFAVCILHTVEQLHAVHVVHADIKPDNFILSQRFLENECFDPESTEHGLVLNDLGQSIDLQMFPDGTAFTTTCLTSGFQCTKMLSGKPWSYQTDYFGIAVTCSVCCSGPSPHNADQNWSQPRSTKNCSSTLSHWGVRSEQILIDSHVKNTNFTAEINMFTAWYQNMF